MTTELTVEEYKANLHSIITNMEQFVSELYKEQFGSAEQQSTWSRQSFLNWVAANPTLNEHVAPQVLVFLLHYMALNGFRGVYEGTSVEPWELDLDEL